MDKGIFISYRRRDAGGHARNLHRELIRWFHEDAIFFDHASIVPGEPFPARLDAAMRACGAALVLIGPEWTTTRSAGQLRLDDPADFVRAEVALALALGKVVIPVLLDDADMPDAIDLPANLAGLAALQAHPLRGAADEYGDGIRRLVVRLRKVPGLASSRALPRAAVEVPVGRGFAEHRAACFTGRSEELKRMREVLAPGALGTSAPVRRLALIGAPGIGKSALAREFAGRHWGDFEAVRWCRADSASALTEALAQLADDLQLPDLAPQTDARARAGLEALARAGSGWLLIYDNVEDAAHCDGLTPPDNVAWLVTSRSPAWTARMGAAHQLDELTRQEAVALLIAKAGREASEFADPADAEQLVDLVGGFPLELDHAGAYCRAVGISFAKYAQRLAPLLDKVPADTTYRASTAATFSMAMEEAHRRAGSATRLITCAAFCMPDSIPRELLMTVVDSEQDLLDGLEALHAVSLFQYVHTGPESPVRIHRAVQFVRRHASELKGTLRDDVTSRLGAALLAAFPTDGYEEPESWPTCGKLAPHAQSLWQHLRNRVPGVDTCKLLDSVSMYLLGRSAGKGADMSTAESLLAEIVELRSSAPTVEEQCALALSMSNLALVYHYQARLTEAYTLCKKALDLRRKIEDPKLAWSVNNYAYLLLDMGRFDEAVEYFQESLDLSEADDELPPAELALAHDNLGLAQLAQGEITKADASFEKALEIYALAHGVEAHTDTALVHYHQGKALAQRGQFEDALAKCLGALAVFDEKFEPGHIDSGEVLCAIGTIYRQMGEAASARAFFENALRTYARAGLPDHQDSAPAWMGRAEMLFDDGDRTEAIKFLERAVAIRIDTVGEGTGEVARLKAQLSQWRGEGSGVLSAT